jgi:hypothetical protein
MADAAAGERRVLDERHLLGYLRQQSHRAGHHVIEVDSIVEELVDGAPLGLAERLDARKPVDEQSVSTIGGHPPRAGVRLGDEPLVLERRHVIADGRRGDAQIVPLHERLGAHRLVGGDVVLHDRAQDGESALLEHDHLLDWHSSNLSAKCNAHAGDRRAPHVSRSTRV